MFRFVCFWCIFLIHFVKLVLRSWIVEINELFKSCEDFIACSSESMMNFLIDLWKFNNSGYDSASQFLTTLTVLSKVLGKKSLKPKVANNKGLTNLIGNDLLFTSIEPVNVVVNA